MANYWENQNASQQGPRVAQPPSGKATGQYKDSDIGALVASLNLGATPDQLLTTGADRGLVAAALARYTSNRGNTLLPQTGDFSSPSPAAQQRPDIASRTASIFNSFKNDNFGSPAAPQENPANFSKLNGIANQIFSTGARTAQGQSAANKLGGIASQILGVVEKIGTQYDAEQAYAQSPMGLYEQLMSQADPFKYGGPTPEQMANSEFAPQFEILKQAAARQGQQYNSGKQEIGTAYDALSRGIISDRNATKGNFDASVGQVNDNYAKASQNVTGNFDSSMSKMGQVLQSLGITEGADTLAANKQAVMGQQLGQLAGNQQTAANLQTSLGANQYAYDTERSGLARQAGVQRQGDLMSQYMDALAQNDAQRLGLEGQKQSAQNAYGMDIQKMLQSGQASQADQIAKLVGMQTSYQGQQQENDLSRARLDMEANAQRLDADRFSSEQSYKAQQDSMKNLNPYQALQNSMLGTYGDANSAKSNADQVFATWMNNPNADIYQLLNDLDPQWAAQPGNKEAAFDFFQKMISSQKG